MILFIIIMYKVEYVLFFKNSMKQKFTYIWINYRKESNIFLFLISILIRTFEIFDNI